MRLIYIKFKWISLILPSKWGVGANVMKNLIKKEIVYKWNFKYVYECYNNLGLLTWLPFVSGPALAILITPAPVCFKSGWISSLNVVLYTNIEWMN